METATNEWISSWWTAMVCINLVSFVIGLAIFRHSARTQAVGQQVYLKRMRSLGLVFIAVALYRSIFVSSYLEQLAWFDSLANSSLLIRFLAFFAELSFAGLFALSLLQFNREVPALPGGYSNRLTEFMLTRSPQLLFACIFVAQFFATLALVSKFEVLFAIEETLWGLAFISVIPLAVNQLSRAFSSEVSASAHSMKMYRCFAVMTTTWCLFYCSYSLLYHLPVEYWPHVIRDLQSGNVEFRWGIGAIRDALLIVNPTRGYDAWGGIGFFIWHSGYFSVCVWMVLFLMSGPRLLPQRAGPVA